MDTPSRRQELKTVTIGQTTHPGLWLDKYLKKQVEGGGDNAKADHFKAAARSPVPAAYKTFFERWTKSLDAAGAVSQFAKAQGRLAIGLGNESVLETAITLHRTYGVPYIPGSALKGLAAHYAHMCLDTKWRKGSDAYNTLFGETTEAGYVTFLDALYVPGSSKGDQPLALDVITVHHPDYYQGKNSPPADWDSPTPIPFLSATGSYLIALHGAESWVEAAFEILGLALKEEGIGAKTSSGYGRMTLSDVIEATESYSHENQRAPLEKRPRRPQDLQAGQILEGQVQGIASFGAFVDIGVGHDGLIHISELAEGFVKRVEDVVQIGQTVRVKVLTIEQRGRKWRIGLSLKNA
jgi:CRISPR-associated protein Cmr6